jgi:hypothetical protein
MVICLRIHLGRLKIEHRKELLFVSYYNNSNSFHSRRQTKRQQDATAGTGYTVEPHDSRAFALYDHNGSLVAVFSYLKGAEAVAHRLFELERLLAKAKEV